MNYPKRGQVSDDGKYYTHTDGRVHYRVERNPSEDTCSFCSVAWLAHDGKPCATCEHAMLIVEGAYVPSDEEREACEMARNMIAECYAWISGMMEAKDCSPCPNFADKSCPARKYPAAHGDEKAWEVKQ